MRPKPKPGFLLVARREWRWLRHDRTALILIFGVPLFAFAVLTAVFSHPVIRELGVVIVDADRSETSRAFAEEVAASPGLSIVERADDLASAARAIRSGDAIGAVYLPADFERDLKAGRRPQVVGFYNQQFLTAAGIAASSSERQPLRSQQERSRANGAEGLSHRLACRRDHRTGQPAEELRAVSAAHAVADGTARDYRNCRRLCSGFRIRPPQHARVARLRGRQSDCRTRRQACAAVRNFLRPRALGGAHFGGSARDRVQGRRANDPCCRGAAAHRLFGTGRIGAAFGGRPRDRPRPHRRHRVAGIRLCRRGVSHFRDECVRASLERDPAIALVHGGAARASGAGIAAFRIRAPVRGAGNACRTLLIVCISSSARGRAQRDPRRPRSRAAGWSCGAARDGRRFRCRVAPRPGDPRGFHPAGGYATGLRLLLPAALSQSNSAQDPDRGRRQRPQRVELAHRANAGRERRRQSGDACRDTTPSTRGARPRRRLRGGRHPARDRARRAQRHRRPCSDLRRCHLPVHLQNYSQRYRRRDQYAVVRTRCRRRTHRRQPG